MYHPQHEVVLQNLSKLIKFKGQKQKGPLTNLKQRSGRAARGSSTKVEAVDTSRLSNGKQ